MYQNYGMMEWCLLKFLRKIFLPLSNILIKQIKKIIFWHEGAQKTSYFYTHLGEDILAKWKNGEQEKGINLEKNRNWEFPRWSKVKTNK